MCNNYYGHEPYLPASAQPFAFQPASGRGRADRPPWPPASPGMPLPPRRSGPARATPFRAGATDQRHPPGLRQRRAVSDRLGPPEQAEGTCLRPFRHPRCPVPVNSAMFHGRQQGQANDRRIDRPQDRRRLHVVVDQTRVVDDGPPHRRHRQPLRQRRSGRNSDRPNAVPNTETAANAADAPASPRRRAPRAASGSSGAEWRRTGSQMLPRCALRPALEALPDPPLEELLHAEQHRERRKRMIQSPRRWWFPPRRGQ